MIDPVDRAVRAMARRDDDVLITEDTRRRLRTEGIEFDARLAVELQGKQVHLELWAPRAHPAGGSDHGAAGSDRRRAGASVSD